MELSGSASHIASMMYEHTILAAVTETIQEFEAPHGRNELKGICARPWQKTGAARLKPQSTLASRRPPAVPACVYRQNRDEMRTGSRHAH